MHHVVRWSAFVRRSDSGEVLLDSRIAGVVAAPGDVMWGDAPGPRTLENVGAEPIHIVSVEVKPAE